MLRKAASKFSIRNIFKRKPKVVVPKKDADLQMLDDFTLNIHSIAKVNADSHHPIHTFALNGRHLLDSNICKLKTPLAALEELDKYLGNMSVEHRIVFEDSPTGGNIAVTQPNKSSTEAVVRIILTRQYFKRLKKAFADGDLPETLLTLPTIRRMFDVLMRGTASERIEEHMRLYGPEFNQERMQECFYSLYEPEIQTCTELFLAKQSVHPHHRKELPKFAKTYLLDKHELNVKLRCVLAWSDPNYSGFQSLPSTLSMNVKELMKARRDFYESGSEVGLTFVRDYIAARNVYYNTKEENRTTMKRGVAFFIATCLLDWAVCVI